MCPFLALQFVKKQHSTGLLDDAKNAQTVQLWHPAHEELGDRLFDALQALGSVRSAIEIGTVLLEACLQIIVNSCAIQGLF